MIQQHEFNPFENSYQLNIKGNLIDFSTPKIMGIVNLTPDSFYEDSRKSTEKDIMQAVEKHLSEGADFIDIGAFTSRPSSKLISQKEEEQRLGDIIKKVVKEFDPVVSVDTYRSEIAKKVVGEGASMINDISGGTLDGDMFKTMAELKVPYIAMHMQGIPESMQVDPKYIDVFSDIYSVFTEKLKQLNDYGVADVILDVGFGFGKTLEHNYTLLKKLKYFHSLQCPILVGLSRKGMIQKVIEQKAENALNGSTVAHTLALMNGANILRVHDVRAAKEAIQIVSFYQKQ